MGGRKKDGGDSIGWRRRKFLDKDNARVVKERVEIARITEQLGGDSIFLRARNIPTEVEALDEMTDTWSGGIIYINYEGAW